MPTTLPSVRYPKVLGRPAERSSPGIFRSVGDRGGMVREPKVFLGQPRTSPTVRGAHHLVVVVPAAVRQILGSGEAHRVVNLRDEAGLGIEPGPGDVLSACERGNGDRKSSAASSRFSVVYYDVVQKLSSSRRALACHGDPLSDNGARLQCPGGNVDCMASSSWASRESSGIPIDSATRCREGLELDRTCAIRFSSKSAGVRPNPMASKRMPGELRWERSANSPITGWLS